MSSRNMYSEHGFDALMRPVFGHVCQRLIVESYCTPGSAHAPRRLGDLAPEVFGLERLADLTRRAEACLPLAARERRAA